MAYKPVGIDENGNLPPRAQAALELLYGISAVTKHTAPSGLGWISDFNMAPKLTVMRGGRVYGDAGITAKQLFAAYSQAQANPTNRYYCAPSGSDTNAGTYAAPFRSIKKCIQTANAAGAPARIMVTTGSYLDGNGFEGVSPTVDTAFIATSGPVTVGTALGSAGFTFAAHATYTNTYYVNPTPNGGISRVLDITRVNEFGNYVELTKVASADLANITPDSYYEGPALYIRRRDGAQPTATNTLILQTKSNFLLTSEVNCYIGTEDGSPWTIQGSPNSFSGADPAAVIAHIQTPSNAARKAFVMENARVMYAGEQTASCNGVTVSGWNGIAAFFNCSAHAPSKDGFNAHNLGNAAAGSYLLTVNCASHDTGRLQASSNGLTIHENMKAIDIAGDYRRGRGGTVHNINASKHYLLGTTIVGDLGDIDSNVSGSIPPAGVMVNDTAELWAERVDVNMPRGTFAYRTLATGAKIHKRNCAPVPQPDAGIGVIDSF